MNLKSYLTNFVKLIIAKGDNRILNLLGLFNNCASTWQDIINKCISPLNERHDKKDDSKIIAPKPKVLSKSMNRLASKSFCKKAIVVSWQWKEDLWWWRRQTRGIIGSSLDSMTYAKILNVIPVKSHQKSIKDRRSMRNKHRQWNWRAHQIASECWLKDLLIHNVVFWTVRSF